MSKTHTYSKEETKSVAEDEALTGLDLSVDTVEKQDSAEAIQAMIEALQSGSEPESIGDTIQIHDSAAVAAQQDWTYLLSKLPEEDRAYVVGPTSTGLMTCRVSEFKGILSLSFTGFSLAVNRNTRATVLRRDKPINLAFNKTNLQSLSGIVDKLKSELK